MGVEVQLSVHAFVFKAGLLGQVCRVATAGGSQWGPPGMQGAGGSAWGSPARLMAFVQMSFLQIVRCFSASDCNPIDINIKI